jgi:hypothetical protein
VRKGLDYARIWFTDAALFLPLIDLPRTRVLVLWLLVCLGAGRFARAQDTAFIYDSEAGDYVGHGRQETLAPPSYVLSASYSPQTGTTMEVRSVGKPWTLTFVMPSEAAPRVGVYPLKSWPNSAGLAVLEISPPDVYWGNSYDDFDGSVEIKKVIFDQQGLAALWLTIDVRLGGQMQSFRGDFRFHSNSQAASVNQAPQVLYYVKESTVLEEVIALQPKVTDDGLPAGNQLQAHWEILGAGAAYGAFADADAATTSVTFHEPGFYTVRLHVSDGDRETVLDRTITAAIPANRNLLHLTGPGGEVRVKDAYVAVQDYASLYGYENFEMWDYGLRTFSGSSAFITTGFYDARAGANVVPRLVLYRRFNYNIPSVIATKFQVRQGSRDPEIGRYGVFWSTFPQYGLEDEPITLSEFRYNIPPESVIGAAPVVDAGVDRVLTTVSARRLHGAAMAIDGASDAPLQTLWEVISGPGDVGFADATAPDSDVTFSALGTYVLRLTATQGAATVADEVTLDVTDRETSLTMRDYRQPPASAAASATPVDYVFRVESFTPDKVVITVDRKLPSATGSQADHFRLEFSTGSAEPLTVKTYVDTVGFGQGGAQLNVALPGGVWFTGEFAVKELKVDAAGNLSVFRVVFTEYVTDYDGTRTEAPLEGELRWRADVSQVGPNLSPRVSAGPPQYVSGGLHAKMEAVVQDDLLPLGHSLDLQWETVSGPGTATADSATPRATMTFPAAGTYVLRFTASDGEYTVSDEVTIVVGSGAQSYRGFVVNGNNVILGSFQATVLASGRFTGLALTVLGSRLPLKGAFVDGAWYDATNDVTLRRLADNTPITGEFWVNGEKLRIVSGATSETYLRALHQASPYAGAYTWLTDVPAPGAGPLGSNYGTARVNANGSCAFAGRLSDGRAFAYGGWVDLEGIVPLVWTVPRQELLGGPVRFARTPLNGISMAGSLPWSRARQANDPRFALGFGFVSQLLGARYRAPAVGVNPVNLQPGVVQLAVNSWADTWGPRHDDRSLKPSGVVSTGAGLQMRVDPRTGLFRGTLLDLQGKARAFGGAFLQGLNFGGGNFLADHGGGLVRVKAE